MSGTDIQFPTSMTESKLSPSRHEEAPKCWMSRTSPPSSTRPLSSATPRERIWISKGQRCAFFEARFCGARPEKTDCGAFSPSPPLHPQPQDLQVVPDGKCTCTSSRVVNHKVVPHVKRPASIFPCTEEMEEHEWGKVEGGGRGAARTGPRGRVSQGRCAVDSDSHLPHAARFRDRYRRGILLPQRVLQRLRPARGHHGGGLPSIII